MKSYVYVIIAALLIGFSASICAFGGFGFATYQPNVNHKVNSSNTVIDGTQGRVVVGRINRETAVTTFKMSSVNGTSEDTIYTKDLMQDLEDEVAKFDVPQVQAGVYISCQTTVYYHGGQGKTSVDFKRHEYTSTGEETGLGLFSQAKYLAKLCVQDYEDNSYLK